MGIAFSLKHNLFVLDCDVRKFVLEILPCKIVLTGNQWTFRCYGAQFIN